MATSQRVLDKLRYMGDNDRDDYGGASDKDADNKVVKQTPVADDGAQPKRFNEPSQSYRNPGKNLGKFLHPKKDRPANEVNGTVDANTGGAKVRATQ